MKLKDIVNSLRKREDWQSRYQNYVPKFIDAAKSHSDWNDWDKDVFNEFFEKSKNQCVSSLQNGYYNYKEKQLLKDNWAELSSLLLELSNNQKSPDFELYARISKFIRQHTAKNMQAATNRIIASLQPQLLCTVVATDHLKILYDKLKPILKDVNFPEYDKNNWFKNSNNILNYFKTELDTQDSYEIMTYPWQIKDDWSFNKTKVIMTENELKKKVDLLKHKKQIILQGPPGTGKTRLAKEIAQKLGASLTTGRIKKSLKLNAKLANASGAEDYYTVKEIKENSLVLVSERTTQDWEPTYSKIIEKYNQLVNGEIPENKKGLHPYELAVAKYFFNDSNYSYQLIQFHPSYTYEDFVRGISVKSGENELEYITENKILGKIAKEAHQNYLDSKKESSEITKEKWLEEQFKLFKGSILDGMDDDGKFKLNDAVNIIEIEDDAFRYTGVNNWSSTRRMKYSDIIKLYNSKVKDRQEIQHQTDVNALARSHATYFKLVLDLFYSFMKEKVEPTDFNEKVELKNYVLIIDEINRANLSSVLGELIYALEYRGEPVESMYEMEDGGNTIILPPNLYIIGTMNTADRSVGQIDYAIRRRFAFVDVLPEALNESFLEDGLKFETNNFNKVAELFDEKNDFLSDEFNAKDVQLGHSYFIYEDGQFELKLEYEIKPILREYVADGILKDSALEEIEAL